MPRLLQRLRKAEQLRLHLLAIRKELNVVHQQDIHILEAAAERISLSRRDRRVERLDVLVQGQVLDVELGGDGFRGVADGHQHVGLPQPGATIDEERVVGRARVLGDRAAGRDGQTIGGAHDERLEGEAGIEGARHATGLPAASFLRTNSEIPFSVSNTPVP